MTLSLNLEPHEVRYIIDALQAKFMTLRDINKEAEIWALKLKVEAAARYNTSDNAKPIFCAPGFEDGAKIGDFSGGTKEESTSN